MEFDIEATNETFLKVFKPLQVMYDEGIIKMDREGISCNVVNPSHVAFVKLNAKASLFNLYSIKQKWEFGLDISKMIRMFERRTFKKKEHKTILSINTSNPSGKIFIKSKKVNYEGYFDVLDTAGILSPSYTLNEQDWKYRIKNVGLIKSILQDLKEEAGFPDWLVLKGSEKFFNICIPVDYYSIINKDTRLKGYILKQPDTKLIGKSERENEVLGCYPYYEIWYAFWGISKAFGRNAEVEIEFDHNYPLKISAKNEYIDLTYYVAPRIEHDW